MKISTKEEKECMREWYKNNKLHHLKKVKERLKKNNYSYEKTQLQRLIRNIKRRTRYYYPLKGHNCEFCGDKATEHHHYSIPIEFDKFNFICHDCHKKEDLKLNNHSKKKVVRRL